MKYSNPLYRGSLHFSFLHIRKDNVPYEGTAIAKSMKLIGLDLPANGTDLEELYTSITIIYFAETVH